MNTGMGDFAKISEIKAKTIEEALRPFIKKGELKGSGIFRTGEELSIKGCNFVVNNISRHTLSLRLLPDDNFQQIPKH